MPELEAITNLGPTKERPHAQPAQFGRRFNIQQDKSLRLGRDESRMDCAIPEDDQISRYFGNLEWTGTSLRVARRGSIPPDYPEPPANKIVTRDPADETKFVEQIAIEVGFAQPFWIGQTQFCLRKESDTGHEIPVDATIASRREERTRAQLEEIPFTNPKAALKAMEQIPSMIKSATNEQGLFRQMLRVVMEALPRADASGIVRIPPDCPPGERKLALVESNVRPTSSLGQIEFTPSRRLAHTAIIERKRSCLHCWTADSTQRSEPEPTEMTLGAMQPGNHTPWAVCTPFQDGSKFALYVSGRASGQWQTLTKQAQDKIIDDLTQYQKIIEIVVGVIATTVQISRLSRQKDIIRRAWPQNLWKYLDDPDRMEAMLRPQEKEITILFCDLRNYSLFASENASKLLEAQQKVSVALNIMSSAITDRDGVVAGFRGDAVLGFWGWPQPHDRQIEMATKVALAIPGRLADNAQKNRCGIGLTHGKAVAGRLGAHDLAVVDLYGPVVNLAFRLESMTKAFGVGVIVSLEVATRIEAFDPDGNELRTRSLGMVQAKGFPEPVRAFELYAAHSPTWNDSLRHEWNQAIDQFTNGKWSDAAGILGDYFCDDSVAQCLMRVIDATRQIPPKNWNGSFVPPALGE